MKHRKLLLPLLFVLHICIYAAPRELFVRNSSNMVIKIDVYPVGCIFNGNLDYSLRCARFYTNYQYITGNSIKGIEPTVQLGFEHDAENHDEDDEGMGNDIAGVVGYGKYRIDFYEKTSNNPETYVYRNFCYIDYSHSNYPWNPGPNGLTNDIYVYYMGNGDVRGWSFSTLPFDRTLKIWDQRNPNAPNAYEPQNKSGFKSTNNGEWLTYPLDATIYQGEEPWGHETKSKCFVFIDVLPSHNPKIICGETLSIETEAQLILYSSNSGSNFAQFNVGDVPGSSCGAVFINQTGGSVLLMRNTKFTVENGSKLYLEKNSNVTINNLEAEFRLKSGSYYCNRGAKILSGKLIIEKYVQYCLPDPPARIVNYFQDSASIVLENGAELVIPDSTTYVFEGSETALICKDSSSIKFGKNSKLVFQSGARINADGCRFTSYDSTNTWDGIYLIDNANDTLKNCTFENAYNGININPDLAAPIVDTHNDYTEL